MHEMSTLFYSTYFFGPEELGIGFPEMTKHGVCRDTSHENIAAESFASMIMRNRDLFPQFQISGGKLLGLFIDMCADQPMISSHKSKAHFGLQVKEDDSHIGIRAEEKRLQHCKRRC